ncbi:LPS translocon maturation chaperone LptM [Propionivibrio sp.]|uniref:LPS translocon maturation chaperone LptM n=1 Tax=Propionivibrio sp. TaxID=2212460 RepID=UPI003FA6A9BD
MCRYITLSLLLSATLLSSCGTRGSLYLPPQQKAPATASSTPTTIAPITAKTTP